MKKCSACSESKSASEFRKYAGRTPDGLRPLCAECQRKYEENWRKKNKERLRKARWIRSPKAREYARRYRAANRAAYLVAEVRRRCERLDMVFSLDVTEIQNRIDKGVCELTGYPLDLTPLTVKNQRRPNAPSLDRCDPSQGYTMLNIRVVCLAANLAMSNWGEAGFLPIAKSWVKKAQ